MGCGNSVQAESHILYRQRKGGDLMLMNYEFFINGEKRMPTQKEKQILMDRMMEKLGYERVVDDKDGDQKKAVV